MPTDTTPCRHRLVAVALVATWIGAFARASPATGAQSMPKPGLSACRLVADPLHPGRGYDLCP